MLFRNYGLSKTWLDKCLENPLRRHCWNTVETWRLAPLTYLMITLKVIEIGKVSLRDMKNLRLFVNIVTTDDKYFAFNIDHLNWINSEAVI